MPFKYDHQTKRRAFQLLVQSLGDTHYVSRETGISQRALQYWKRAYKNTLPADSLPTPETDPERLQRKRNYAAIRDALNEQIDNIVAHMQHHNTPEMAAQLTPSLSRLIDRLHKIEGLLAETNFTIRIVCVDPADLITHDDDIDRAERDEVPMPF